MTIAFFISWSTSSTRTKFVLLLLLLLLDDVWSGVRDANDVPCIVGNCEWKNSAHDQEDEEDVDNDEEVENGEFGKIVLSSIKTTVQGRSGMEESMGGSTTDNGVLNRNDEDDDAKK